MSNRIEGNEAFSKLLRWQDSDGKPLPKTAAGIKRFKALLKQFTEEYGEMSARRRGFLESKLAEIGIVIARKATDAVRDERNRKSSVRSNKKFQDGLRLFRFQDFNGKPIPQTEKGIEAHQKLVLKYTEKWGEPYRRAKDVILRYADIRKALARKAKSAERDRKAAAERQRVAARVEAARKQEEKWARERAERAEKRRIPDAKKELAKVEKKIGYTERWIAKLEKSTTETKGWIDDLGPKLKTDAYKDSSLYGSLKKNLAGYKEYLKEDLSKLKKYRADLADLNRKKTSVEKFIALPAAPKKAVKKKATAPILRQPGKQPGKLYLGPVNWVREGKFLVPTGDVNGPFNIWVRPDGTGKLRVTSGVDYHDTTADFGGFQVTLKRIRVGFFAANLTTEQVKTVM